MGVYAERLRCGISTIHQSATTVEPAMRPQSHLR